MMSDDPKITLTDGSPVTPDHREINPVTGLQKGYIVLSEEERRKGFVRPVRRTYVHVGVRPKYPTRDLTEDEQQQHAAMRYVAYEQYPESESPRLGRFWTKAQLESGCGVATTMAVALAETYARDPSFYSGTYCVGCRTHLPLEEFVWDGTDQLVGS